VAIHYNEVKNMKDMIQHIRALNLPLQFRAADIISALKKNNEPIYYVGTYLWKHSDKNLKPNSGRKYFTWISKGLYSLK
jgi:hypothetical protein